MVEYNKDELVSGKRFVAIGYGPGYGVAREADTKITETVRVPMNGYELEEVCMVHTCHYQIRITLYS